MKRRRGFTLLEVVVTIGLMSITITSICLLLRSSAATWEAFDSDHGRLEEAHHTVRHFIRGLRQADSVVSITASTNTSGSITLNDVDGSPITWTRVSNDIQYTSTVSAANVMASNITELSFLGLKADGVTPTVVPTEIRSVRITVTVALDREAGSSRTIRCAAWLREKK